VIGRDSGELAGLGERHHGRDRRGAAARAADGLIDFTIPAATVALPN
jgi:dihydrodipicolinate reductase